MTAKVFEDRRVSGDWRVEWIDEDGGIEVAIFSGPNARERALGLMATGRYLGEGFDDARLDTLFLTMPISWLGILAQYAGRLHRMYATKRDVVIYDYADGNEPMLARWRSSGTRSVASSSPSWPVSFSRCASTRASASLTRCFSLVISSP
jgi:hypothetical protein